MTYNSNEQKLGQLDFRMMSNKIAMIDIDEVEDIIIVKHCEGMFTAELDGVEVMNKTASSAVKDLLPKYKSEMHNRLTLIRENY